jgi:hypothetical protein
MPNLTLTDGREITIDLSVITVREYRALFDKKQKQEDEDATLAKACGLTAEDILDMSQPDFRRLAAAFFKTAREPLADPNSVSESTTE